MEQELIDYLKSMEERICNKLNDLDKKIDDKTELIPAIFEMVEANGQRIEILDSSINEIKEELKKELE